MTPRTWVTKMTDRQTIKGWVTVATNIPRTVAIGGIYQHYKGPCYIVLFVGKDSNNDRNGERTVVYMSMDEPYRGAVRVRHLDEFLEQMLLSDGRIVNRFEFLYLAKRQ